MNDENETLFIPTKKPESDPTVVAPRRVGIEYSVEHQGDDFIIATNADDAAPSGRTHDYQPHRTSGLADLDGA